MSRSSRPKVNIRPAKKTMVGPDTRFHIDYSWWDEEGLSIETHLRTKFGAEISLDPDESNQVDLIDPVTGEVRQLSGFEFAVQNYFSQLASDFAQRTSTVEAIFCVLLANGNRPMSATEISEEIRSTPERVYKTVGSDKVYRGIRIYQG